MCVFLSGEKVITEKHVRIEDPQTQIRNGCRIDTVFRPGGEITLEINPYLLNVIKGIIVDDINDRTPMSMFFLLTILSSAKQKRLKIG